MICLRHWAEIRCCHITHYHGTEKTAGDIDIITSRYVWSIQCTASLFISSPKVGSVHRTDWMQQTLWTVTIITSQISYWFQFIIYTVHTCILSIDFFHILIGFSSTNTWILLLNQLCIFKQRSWHNEQNEKKTSEKKIVSNRIYFQIYKSKECVLNKWDTFKNDLK